MLVTIFERSCLFVERMAAMWLEHRRAVLRESPLSQALRMQAGPMPLAQGGYVLPTAVDGVPIDASGRDVGTFRGMYGNEAIGE